VAANNTDWLTPAGIGAGVAILIQLVTLFLQKRKIQVDDGASLRKDLMSERQKLIEDVARLSQRFTELETVNHQLRLENIELSQKLGLSEVAKAKYEARIEALERDLKDVKENLSPKNSTE
jgi:hypothetical protein